MKINLDSNCSAESECITDRSYQLGEGQICIQLIKERLYTGYGKGIHSAVVPNMLSHFIGEEFVDKLVK